MKYPVNCNKCAQALYGPVKYCPFCGTASPSITATDDKQNLDTLKQPEPKTTEETQPTSTGLRFSATRVDFDGVDVGSGLRNKTVSYEKIGDHLLAGSISSDADFLTVTPSSLSPGSGAIEVALDTNKVQPGQVYSQQVRIKYNGADNALSIPVEIRVNPLPPPSPQKKAEIRCDPAAVNFVDVVVATSTHKRTISYKKIGEQSLVGTISTDAPRFLTVTPSSLSSDSGEIEIALDTSKINWGEVSTGHIVIAYNGADSPQRIPVTINVKAGPLDRPKRRLPLPALVFIAVFGLWALYSLFKDSPSNTPPPGVQFTVMVAKDGRTPVRKGPSTSDSILGTMNLRKGQLFTALERRGDWYNVKLRLNGKDATGWIEAPLLLRQSDILPRVKEQLAGSGFADLNAEFDASGILSISGTVTRSDQIPRVSRIVSGIPGVGKVDVARLRVEGPAEPPASPLNHLIASKDITDLNVRAGPSMSDRVLATVNIRRGELLEVLEARGDWYRVKIKLGGKDSDGWVYKSYFDNRDELLARVTTLLATNGYGNLGAQLDPSGKIVISGDVKHSVDIETVRRLVVNLPGVADVDTSRLKAIAGSDKSDPGVATASFTHSIPSHLWSSGIEQLQQIINYASLDGGISHENEITFAKQRIEQLRIKNELPASNRNVARVANQKGLDELKRGQSAKALQAFQEAYRADPGDVEVINNLGHAYMLTSDFASAEKSLTFALLLAPARGAAWTNLGQLYAKEGKEKEAVAAFANTYRFSQNRNRSYDFFRELADKDDDIKVRNAARKTLELKLLRPFEKIPPPPDDSTRPSAPAGAGWIVTRMKARLQDAGFGNIKVEESGSRKIVLSGEVGSRQDVERIKAIASREAKISDQAIVVEHAIDVRPAQREPAGPVKTPGESQTPPFEREQGRKSIAPLPRF